MRLLRIGDAWFDLDRVMYVVREESGALVVHVEHLPHAIVIEGETA